MLRPTGTEIVSTNSLPNSVLGPQRTPTPVPGQARPQSTPAIPQQGMHAQLALPGFQQIAQHQLFHQADHLQNMMAQRLQHLQQETIRLQHDMMAVEQRTRDLAAVADNPAMPPSQRIAATQAPFVPGLQNSFQGPHVGIRATQPLPASVANLINQQQRERAAEGRLGAQDTSAIPQGAGFHRSTSSGRASPTVFRPNHTTTHTREGIGPNGERWQITVNETTTTFPMTQLPHHHLHHPHPHPPQQGQVNNPVLDNLQAILRDADRVLAAAQALQNNPNRPNNIEDEATNPTPTINTGATESPRSSSAPPTGTSAPSVVDGPPAPALLNQLPIAPHPATIPAVQESTNRNIDPVVYLLSSPNGPRAVLMSNSNTFYTPRQSSRRRIHDSPAPAANRLQNPRGPVFPYIGNRIEDRRRIRVDQNGNAQNQNRLAPVAPHAHANPGAGALAAQIGPMIWLIIRLAGFVWFFTAGNSSWTRFLIVAVLAFGVLIVNTGIFNGIAEQLWGPIRRHIEALIPLAGPEAALVPAANAAIPQHRADAPAAGNEQRPPRRRRGELDPAEVAAHLIEQHRRANDGWLMAQIRRAEHAALLFLASLVPGVGERHIAAREAEAAATEAERQRLLEAEAEAEAAGDAHDAAENAEELRSDQAADGGSDAERPQGAQAPGNSAPSVNSAAEPAQALLVD